MVNVSWMLFIADVRTSVKNKVPLVRSMTLNWVTFCIETSNKAVVLKLHKDYVPIFMEVSASWLECLMYDFDFYALKVFILFVTFVSCKFLCLNLLLYMSQFNILELLNMIWNFCSWLHMVLEFGLVMFKDIVHPIIVLIANREKSWKSIPWPILIGLDWVLRS